MLQRCLVTASAIAALLLAGCADLQTIGRTTTLPASADITSPGDSRSGLAVHLDAPQRVVIVNKLGKFCSEPNPAAVNAYASALGIGASAPGTGAASGALANQSSTGSIDLRTQSISLMREQLFLLCAMYVNEAIDPVQVATFIGRSQDLTALVLAIEQLTGAVAANQVILTSAANAGAMASLSANDKLLESATANVAEKEEQLTAAVAERDAAQAEVDSQETAVAVAAQATRDAEAAAAGADPPADANQIVAQRRTEERQARDELRRREAILQGEKNDVTLKETLLENARKLQRAVENEQSQALTNATANTSAQGQFSTPVARKELSKEATVAIAGAVKEMVTEVLRKSYSFDTCMAALTHVPKDFALWPKSQQDLYVGTLQFCKDLMTVQIREEIAGLTAGTYGADDSTEAIRAAMAADSTLRGRLDAYLRKLQVTVTIPEFLNLGEFAGLRKRAIKDLGIR